MKYIMIYVCIYAKRIRFDGLFMGGTGTRRFCSYQVRHIWYIESFRM